MAYTPGNRTSFILEFSALARTTSAACGVLPEVVLAQAALETGWGIAAPQNNFFGIKGRGGSFSTREFVKGKWITIKQNFRGYATPADSFAGYAQLIKTYPRYKKFRTAVGIEAQTVALQASGYATAPNYGETVKLMAENIMLAEPIYNPGAKTVIPKPKMRKQINLNG